MTVVTRKSNIIQGNDSNSKSLSTSSSRRPVPRGQACLIVMFSSNDTLQISRFCCATSTSPQNTFGTLLPHHSHPQRKKTLLPNAKQFPGVSWLIDRRRGCPTQKSTSFSLEFRIDFREGRGSKAFIPPSSPPYPSLPGVDLSTNSAFAQWGTSRDGSRI